jgi:hypothetical protein
MKNVMTALYLFNFKRALSIVAMYKQIQNKRKRLEREFYSGGRNPKIELEIRKLAEKMYLLESHKQFHGVTLKSLLEQAKLNEHSETIH